MTADSGTDRFYLDGMLRGPDQPPAGEDYDTWFRAWCEHVNERIGAALDGESTKLPEME